MENKTFEKLKYNLVRDNLVSYEELEKAQEIATAQKINVAQVLVNSNVIELNALMRFLESNLHIPYVELDDYSLDCSCLKYITFNDALKYKVIPLFKIEKTLTVAMSDPLDSFSIEQLVQATSNQSDVETIEPVLSSEASILQKIEEYYRSENSVGEIFTDEAVPKYDWREELTNENLSDDHTQNIIRAILKQAILENVHELFFEQASNELKVNFKKDSSVEQKGEIPYLLVAPIISKLKILSNLDPTVSEIPQLGKLNFKVDETNFIASISAFPTIHGERISLKIYKPPRVLSEVLHDHKKVSVLNESLQKPGIVLVCGAALSGKTHLIYSILKNLSDTDKNVMTIESITKYNLENINQCELSENVGFNLDKAMRFIEFQIPDIIYFEGITTKEGLDYICSLVFKNKTIITEFLADNMEDLLKKLSINEFSMFKSLVETLIFIKNKDSIEIFDKASLDRYFS